MSLPSAQVTHTHPPNFTTSPYHHPLAIFRCTPTLLHLTMPKKKGDNLPPPPRRGRSTTAGDAAAASITSFLRSEHSPDAGGAVATSASSSTRKLHSINTGVITVLGIDGATQG